MCQQEQFSLADRLEAILRGHSERQELGEACGLVHQMALEPLLQAWQRNYGRVAPDLASHLKAQSEYVAITSLGKVLRDFATRAARDADVAGPMVEAMVSAEEEVEEIQGAEPVSLE